LPRYRGAAPIQWAIARGETVTGVTIMQIDAGLDTGPMLAKAETPVGPEESALDLAPRLAAIGARLLVETLANLPPAVPQNNAEASLAPILRREDGLIDWSRPAPEIHNRARGFLPWPGAWTWFRGQRFNLWRCRPAAVETMGVKACEPLVLTPEAVETPAPPGKLFSLQKRLYAVCGGPSVLELLEVQPEGRKRMAAADFLNGVHLADNEILGENAP
jgi:methionyl-tRNA formyltransferase